MLRSLPLEPRASVQKIVLAIFVSMIITWIALPTSLHAQNAIVTENALPGNPKSEWDVSGAGDVTLQGFATDMSVNAGSNISFKVKASSGLAYTIDIYRLGWYGGNGARKVASLGTFTGDDQTAPANACATDPTTGLIDCGAWSTATTWTVPAGSVSGLYIARLKYTVSGGASHIIFVVRNDNTTADLLFKTSDATWQAYNVYGGNDLYVGTTSNPNGRAHKVSYNRPLFTRAGGGGGGVGEDGPFNAEYPMIRWLERNGYSTSYVTDVDMDRTSYSVSDFARYHVFMSVGHDEYWSAQARTNFENARSAGVNLAFFSGNEVYWKTRFENSIDGSSTDHRTLVCYKEGTLGENTCNGICDPTNVWTGLWRDGNPATYPTKTGGYQPENALTGQISWAENDAPISVPASLSDLRFWRNTSVATLATGATATMTPATIGYEWDAVNTTTYKSWYPAGRVALTNTTVSGQVHQASLYRYQNANHALVFGAGTVQWSWGLDDVHDRGSDAPSSDMQQATVNLFADMGVQPGSLQNDLVAATGSNDVTAPTVTIASPASGSTLTTGTVAVISGTAADADNTVAGVEVSVDGGTTWQLATGTTNWSLNWTPSSSGSITIKVRTYDDLGNVTASGSEATVSVTTTGPVTLFGSLNPNATKYNDDKGGIVLGMKFRSSQSGFITAIRLLKPTGSTASHLGALYSAGGTLLAQVAFTNETASGWQQANFGTPVAITANTTYVAVYYSDNGDYVAQGAYFGSAVFNSPLEAIQNTSGNPNGLFDYAYQPKFPTQSFNGGNYWVDVVFANSIPPDVTPPTVASTTPSGSATDVSVKTGLSIVMSEELKPSSVSASTVLFTSASGTVSASIVYNTGLNSITITPNSDLQYNTEYTVTMKGGSGTVIKDLANNALVEDYVFSFTTGAAPAPYTAGGQGGPVLVIGSSKNPFSVYATEILRAEGWNAHKSMDIANLTSADLNNYDIAILGEVPLSNTDVTNLTNWVNAGGTLVTFRPDVKLSSLLGLTTTGTTMSDKYLLVNNTAGTAGAGIVNATIQYHGAADLYTVTGSNVTVLATLYSAAATSTAYPAVTSRNVGTHGGQAIAFTYDLAKSVVLTHQGNPSWAGQKRDGTGGPPRSDDMYFGMGSGDYVDLSKVAIPQADEQQRLLNNIMMLGNYDKKPIPRFWFLPKGLKAAVVMTGDDHGNGGTKARFEHFYDDFSAGHNTPTDVANWDAIRYTSYIYPNTSGVVNADVSTFQDQGFEIGLHLNTGCAYWTQGSWNAAWDLQLSQIKGTYPSILAPVTNRTHCIAWSDFASQPKLEAAKGVRLDVNYYYYPGSWVQSRPGMFTGSGNPMRFADIDGTQIDAYQVVTQMTDESGLNYPTAVDALLNKATGAEGYYGVFCANMHTDLDASPSADAIVASAMSRNIPVVTAKQMLTWLDARNNSSFDNMTWNGNQLNFAITQDANALNLKAMLPTNVAAGTLISVTRNGSPLTLDLQTVKGINYAFFDAQGGNFVATYATVTPVTLLDLKGTPVNNTDVKLDWATASESNNKGFDVERSTDGNHWTNAGFVAGAGNSSVKKTYTFTDKNLPVSKYYYRLKQVDFDGKSAYSNIISVSLVPNDNFLLMQNYPNPANGSTTITYHVPREVNVRISVYDQYGRMIRQIENARRQVGSYTVSVDASTLPKGIYYYKMEAEEFSATKKMIIN